AEIPETGGQVLAADDERRGANDIAIRIEHRYGVGGLGSSRCRLDAAAANVCKRGEQHVLFGKCEALIGNVRGQASARATWHLEFPPGKARSSRCGSLSSQGQSSSERTSAAPSWVPRLASIARASLAQRRRSSISF